jgi:hypothetical protein
MKIKPMPTGCGRIAVLLVLTPMMMLNASQAMTLCVGQDGHVALELLVGDHCTCEVRATGAGDARIDGASRLLDGRSQSCSDFVVPVGACGVRAAPATATGIPRTPDAALPLPLPAALDTIGLAPPESPPLLSCYGTPLGSVILRV